MSTEMPNAPMMEPRPASMFETCINAVTKPNESTFAAMASSPNAKATTGFLWVFIGSVVQTFLAFLVQGTELRRLLEQQGLGNQIPTEGLAARVVTLICGAPIAAVIAVVFFAIGAALIQWVAKMFGGKGTYDKLVYTFGAILAPISIVSGVLVLLGAIPFVGFCFNIVASLIGIYALVLEIFATKAVNGFGMGAAAGSVILPGLVIGLLCCCLAFGISALVGASLGNVFSQLGPLTIPTP